MSTHAGMCVGRKESSFLKLKQDLNFFKNTKNKFLQKKIIVRFERIMF
jgi:hypothetical protein